jgi:hypothetical protein
MTDAFILGAGFSKAIDYLQMPTTDELGDRAIELLQSIHRASPRTHSSTCDGISCDHPVLVNGKPPGGSFEVWLSRLAEPQPYRFEHENAVASSLYEQLASAVADTILWATQRCCEQQPAMEAAWFAPLLTAWHERRADVLTFNYDTLVEARFDALQIVDGPSMSRPYNHRDLGPQLLPEAGVVDVGPAGPIPWSFNYMKLHGSIHWYWDPMTRSADSMVDVGLPARWPHNPNDRTWQPAVLVPGRRPVVVPPTTSKTAFFNNPVIRHQWRKAFEAIRSADRVILIGYSLPTYDLLVGSLLDDAARQRGGIPAIVVDLDPVPVGERLSRLGFDIASTFDDVANFVDAYRGEGAA